MQFSSDSEFYDAILHLVYDAMQKEEENEVCCHKNDWILMEANSVRSLQSAGTFCNALFRKVDERITEVFTEIIAFCSCYHNLLHLTVHESDNAMRRMWIRMFHSEELCWRTIVQHASNPGSNLVFRHDSMYFECNFPFSWKVFDYFMELVEGKD